MLTNVLSANASDLPSVSPSFTYCACSQTTLKWCRPSRANSTNHARPTRTWKLASALFCVSKRSRPEFEDKNDVYFAKRSPQAQFHLLPPSLLRIKNKTKTYCRDGLYGRIAENFPFYDQGIVLSPVASCNGGGHHAACHL